MTAIGKACPVVLRHREDGTDILVFRHPLAGMQLVKGTVEPGEKPSRTAQRELFEESGVPTQAEGHLLGSDAGIADGQLWHFVLCPVADLPDNWTFRCFDDGGHLFAFSWHRLGAPMAGADWHPVFVRAMASIERMLQEARG